MALLSRSSKTPPAKPGSKTPAGKTGKDGKPKPPRGARLKTIRTAFSVTRKKDPQLVPLCLAAFFLPFALLLALGFLIDQPLLVGVLGFVVGLLVLTIVFGKRVQKTAFAGVEGQVGAAAAVLSNMRGDW